MPTGPQGQKRPVSDTSSAVMVAKMATGELPKDPKPRPKKRSRKR